MDHWRRNGVDWDSGDRFEHRIQQLFGGEVIAKESKLTMTDLEDAGCPETVDFATAGVGRLGKVGHGGPCVAKPCVRFNGVLADAGRVSLRHGTHGPVDGLRTRLDCRPGRLVAGHALLASSLARVTSGVAVRMPGMPEVPGLTDLPPGGDCGRADLPGLFSRAGASTVRGPVAATWGPAPAGSGHPARRAAPRRGCGCGRSP